MLANTTNCELHFTENVHTTKRQRMKLGKGVTMIYHSENYPYKISSFSLVYYFRKMFDLQLLLSPLRMTYIWVREAAVVFNSC